MIRLRFSFVAVLLVLVMLLSACGGGTESTATPQTSTGGGTANTPAAGTVTSDSTPTEVAASVPAQGTKVKGPDPDTLVRIGFAFSTSGPNGVYGISQRKAAELAW